MSVDYLSQVETLQRALNRFRMVSRSTVDTAVLKGKLSQLRRVLRSVEGLTGGNAAAPWTARGQVDQLELLAVGQGADPGENFIELEDFRSQQT